MLRAEGLDAAYRVSPRRRRPIQWFGRRRPEAASRSRPASPPEQPPPPAKNDENTIERASCDVPCSENAPAWVRRVGLQASRNQTPLGPFPQRVVAAGYQQLARIAQVAWLAGFIDDRRSRVRHQRSGCH